jgi:predicted glutamine amidotransferase
MCRLFFSYDKVNNEKSHEKTIKQLMHFFQNCDKQNMKDGYGISWIQDNKWNTIKNNKSFHTEIQFQ